MEGVRCAPAVGGGIGQRADELQLFDDRPGPSVADDQRKRVLVLGANVDEVDVQPVDLGDVVRDGVEPRFALAPVVLGRPVASEVLHERERHALRIILDGLLFGPPCGLDPGTQVVEIRRGGLDRERPDRCEFRRLRGDDRHVGLLLWGFCDSHEACLEFTRTTPPPSSAGPSGSELSHPVAPANAGICARSNTASLAQ